QNVRFHPNAASAEAAGLRACKRCGGGLGVPAP
ncbi:MAG: Ada metal-binding domain-containing protein, partial [Rhodospirillaceae bacterium]